MITPATQMRSVSSFQSEIKRTMEKIKAAAHEGRFQIDFASVPGQMHWLMEFKRAGYIVIRNDVSTTIRWDV